MATHLTLSMIEFILLLLGAILLGITINIFIANRKDRKAKTDEGEINSLPDDEMKLKYLNDIEVRDKEISTLQQQLRETEENANILSKETEELRQHNNKFESIIEKLEKKIEDMEKETEKAVPPPAPVVMIPNKTEYLDQVLLAQSRLMEQNQKINQLLGSLDIIREKEEKQKQILHDNAELSAQINRMKGELTDKEKEMENMKQKEHLTKEMTSMLDTAYTEFKTLQVKIQKLESQLTSSRMTSLHYEDIKEQYSILIKEIDDYRVKTTSLTNENQQLQLELTQVKDKFKESNFHRQQLQKRITYLEELNADLQLVADANKKLEGQLKQIGKLESMLNIIGKERPGFMRRQGDGE
jgi:chromosome segregation ATPase